MPGANAELTAEDVDVESVRRAEVLLLQLEVPLETVVAAARGRHAAPSSSPRRRRSRCRPSCSTRVDVLVPNEHELAQLAGAAPGERTPARAGRAGPLGRRAARSW